MPEVFTDATGVRVLVRHTGPPGPGIPAGGTAGQIYVKASNANYDGAWANPPNGTGAVQGPTSAVDASFALFDGITGKLIKDSGRALNFYASTSSVANKVDKITGKSLSQEDFTTVAKTKLAALNAGGFRGVFDSLASISAFTFSPVPQPGDYCYIEVASLDAVEVLWDSTNEEWFKQSLAPVSMTGSQIALALFATDVSGSYVQADCKIFTSTEKAQLAAHGAALTSLTGVVLPAMSYGSLAYFSLVGTPITIAAISDGSTGTVKVDVASAVVAVSTGFDSGSSNGRLRYTGTSTQVFLVTAKVACTGAASDVLVFGVAKNGTFLNDSRSLKAMDAAGTVDSLTLSCLVSLATNDYLEVFVGNTTATLAPTIKILSIEAIPT